MEINKNELSFNELPQDLRTEILFKEGDFYNPFEIPDGTILWNPYTLKPITKVGGEVVIPDVEDGDKIFRNPFNSKIIGKALFKDNKVVNAWEVTKDNRWAILEPMEDGTYDVSCRKH